MKRILTAAALLGIVLMSPSVPASEADVEASALEIATLEIAARPTGLPVDRPPPGKIDKLVLRAQKALAKAGYYKGPVDGRNSKATRAAVRAYQAKAGLRVTARITKSLVEGLENSLQVRVLLNRLDKVRIENMSAAREALLNHPATRDLVTGAKDEIADPTRDKTACLDNVTVRCLLTESLESAKAVFKPELRDWALGEILVAQARAGLGPEAMDTASRIRDPRLIIVALRDIAEAQAASGLSGKALAAAGIISDPVKQAEALAAIAGIQVKRGDLDDAKTTAARLQDSLDKISDPLGRVSFQAQAAVILAKAGDGPKAGAKSAGLFSKAVEASREIDDNRLRAHTLWTIAAEQIRAGDNKGAETTKAYANQATGEIKSTLSRVWMFGEIATGHAAAGEEIAAWAAFDHGLTVARSIDNSWGRARAFGRLAATLIELVNPGSTASSQSP